MASRGVYCTDITPDVRDFYLYTHTQIMYKHSLHLALYSQPFACCSRVHSLAAEHKGYQSMAH